LSSRQGRFFSNDLSATIKTTQPHPDEEFIYNTSNSFRQARAKVIH
jgi:hypothetical protein